MTDDDENSLQRYENSHNTDTVPLREEVSHREERTRSNGLTSEMSKTSFNKEARATGKQQLKRLLKKNEDGHYVCDCGYSAGNRSNRLLNHQLKYCPNREVSVRTDIPCPVCDKTFTYDGLKSHLLPFTRANRKSGTYNEAHGSKNAADHQAILAKVKIMYGPKKT